MSQPPDRDGASFPLLYSELAPYWRLMSRPEEYALEAGLWREAIRARLGPGRHELLELGVGGGHNMSHLTGEFAFTAVDRSPWMIEEARKLNPGVEFHVGDMRGLRLGRVFDGVLIHDAISYMLTAEDLRAVFASAGLHLRPGGLLLVAPDWFRETFQQPQVACRTGTDGETEFTYFEYTYDPDPADTTVEILLWYLIREGGREVRVEQERHTCGLFDLATWERLLVEAGFRVEQAPYEVEEHKGLLLIGTWGA